MSYITADVTEALAGHVLFQETETCYLLTRPRTSAFHLNIATVGNHLVLCGDLAPGGPWLHGLVSTGGYEIDWFGDEKSEDYLCSKFLPQVWQWESAREGLADWLHEGDILDADREGIKQLIELPRWYFDVSNEFEFASKMDCFEGCYTDDGLPGYDFCTKTRSVVAGICVSDITERCAEDAWEDFDLSGVGKLNEAVLAFKEENQDHLVYEADYKKAVSLRDYLGGVKHNELLTAARSKESEK